MPVVEIDSKVPMRNEKMGDTSQEVFHISRVRDFTLEELRGRDFQHVASFSWQDLQNLTAEQREWIFHLVEEGETYSQDATHSARTFLQYVAVSLRDLLQKNPGSTEDPVVKEMLGYQKIHEAYTSLTTTKISPAEGESRRREGVSTAYLLRSRRSPTTIHEKTGSQTQQPPTDFFKLIEGVKSPHFEFDQLSPLSFKDLTIDFPSTFTAEEREGLNQIPLESPHRVTYFSSLFEKKYKEFQNLKLSEIKDKNGVSLYEYFQRSLNELKDLNGLPNPAFGDLLNIPEFLELVGKSEKFKSLLPQEEATPEEMSKLSQDKIADLYRQYGVAMKQAQEALPGDDVSTEDITFNKDKKTGPQWATVFESKGWGLDPQFLVKWLAFSLKKEKEILQEKIKKAKEQVENHQLDQENLKAISGKMHENSSFDLDYVNGELKAQLKMWGLGEDGKRILISYEGKVKDYLAGRTPPFEFTRVPTEDENDIGKRSEVWYKNNTALEAEIKRVGEELKIQEAEVKKLSNTTPGLYNYYVKEMDESKKELDGVTLHHSSLTAALLAILEGGKGDTLINIKESTWDGAKHNIVTKQVVLRQYLLANDPRITLDTQGDPVTVKGSNAAKIEAVLKTVHHVLSEKQTNSNMWLNRLTKLLELLIQLINAGAETFKSAASAIKN